MDKLEITPACFIEMQQYCLNKENTGYELKLIYVILDDTITYIDKTYGMYYIEHTHFLHKSEKYYITALGDRIKKEDYEQKYKF